MCIGDRQRPIAFLIPLVLVDLMGFDRVKALWNRSNGILYASANLKLDCASCQQLGIRWLFLLDNISPSKTLVSQEVTVCSCAMVGDGTCSCRILDAGTCRWLHWKKPDNRRKERPFPVVHEYTPSPASSSVTVGSVLSMCGRAPPCEGHTAGGRVQMQPPVGLGSGPSNNDFTLYVGCGCFSHYPALHVSTSLS
jgi:hypothetical protein